MLSHFHLIPERHGQTDRQMDGRMDRRADRIAISISRVSMLTCNKNKYYTKEVRKMKNRRAFWHLYNFLSVFYTAKKLNYIYTMATYFVSNISSRLLSLLKLLI